MPRNWVEFGIVTRRHRQNVEDLERAIGVLLRRLELLPPALDGVSASGEGAQHRRHVRQIAQLEAHIAGMAGGGRPDVGVPQRVGNRAVSAGAFAEHAATPAAAAAEALLDRRQHLVQQEVLPRTGRSRVDVLVAAEPGKAVGKSHDDRRHALFADQPVEPFRQVLAEADPIRMGQAAAGEPDQIDQQRQVPPVVPGRDIDVDDALRRIAEHVARQRLALDRHPADRTRRAEKPAHASCLCGRWSAVTADHAAAQLVVGTEPGLGSIGRSRCRPRSSSSNEAACRSAASPRGLPTSCSPTGRPN